MLYNISKITFEIFLFSLFFFILAIILFSFYFALRFSKEKFLFSRKHFNIWLLTYNIKKNKKIIAYVHNGVLPQSNSYEVVHFTFHVSYITKLLFIWWIYCMNSSILNDRKRYCWWTEDKVHLLLHVLVHNR